METSLKILEKLPFQENKNYLDIAFDILLNEKKANHPNFEKYRSDLEYREKAIISRFFKLMTKVLFVSKPELDAAIQASNLSADYKKYLNHVWDNFNFNRTLNNYSLIKFHFDKSQAYFKDETYVLENKNTDADRGLIGKIGNFAKLDWKIEVTLSSIWMKKVLRPMVLLIFYTKEGQKKSFYLDVYIFQELKKNIALMLRNIHQVEYK